MRTHRSEDFEVEVSLYSNPITNKSSLNDQPRFSISKNSCTHSIWFLAVVNFFMMCFAGTGKGLIIEFNQ